MDDRPGLLCCQTADDAVLQTDGDLFDCGTCALAERLDGLAPENAAAWAAYRQLATRVTVDFGLGATVFKEIAADMPAEDVLELVERLGLIYDIVSPPKVSDAS